MPSQVPGNNNITSMSLSPTCNQEISDTLTSKAQRKGLSGNNNSDSKSESLLQSVSHYVHDWVLRSGFPRQKPNYGLGKMNLKLNECCGINLTEMKARKNREILIRAKRKERKMQEILKAKQASLNESRNHSTCENANQIQMDSVVELQSRTTSTSTWTRSTPFLFFLTLLLLLASAPGQSNILGCTIFSLAGGRFPWEF